MSTQNDACPICLENETDSDKCVRRLSPCEHVVHLDCITKWRNVRDTCPVCITKMEGFVDDPLFFKRFLHGQKDIDLLYAHRLFVLLDKISKKIEIEDRTARLFTFGHVSFFSLLTVSYCLRDCEQIQEYWFAAVDDIRGFYSGEVDPLFQRNMTFSTKVERVLEMINYFNKYEMRPYSLARRASISLIFNRLLYDYRGFSLRYQNCSEFLVYHFSSFVVILPVLLVIFVLFYFN